MIRLGLCCIFHHHPIKFSTTTAAYILRLKDKGGDPLVYLGTLIEKNVNALEEAIRYCHAEAIGCFRVLSQFFPLFTHPQAGYQITDLPQSGMIIKKLAECKKLANELDIRLTLHPDQFVVLNSPSDKVTASSLQELEYHGLLAEFLGADVINIHAGGIYGDKQEALQRFKNHFQLLSKNVQKKLTLENDDKCYTPHDLLPLCKFLGVPLVYDVHHHRCLKDCYSVEKASSLAYATWNREPLFHISSPLDGWQGKNPARHHKYIDPEDWPDNWWLLSPLTVEVEAKFKEAAIKKLQQDLKVQLEDGRNSSPKR